MVIYSVWNKSAKTENLNGSYFLKWWLISLVRNMRNKVFKGKFSFNAYMCQYTTQYRCLPYQQLNLFINDNNLY